MFGVSMSLLVGRMLCYRFQQHLSVLHLHFAGAFSLSDASRNTHFQSTATSCPTHLPGGRRRPFSFRMEYRHAVDSEPSTSVGVELMGTGRANAQKNNAEAYNSVYGCRLSEAMSSQFVIGAEKQHRPPKSSLQETKT